MKRMYAEHSKYSECQGQDGVDYIEFYTQGKACYTWQLPKAWRRQAFQHLTREWSFLGRKVQPWHIRAFLCGASGYSEHGYVAPQVPDQSVWPQPLDPSWDTIICSFTHAYWEMDFAHKVSRRFLSQDRGFPDLPNQIRQHLDSGWFRRMGFIVIDMRRSSFVSMGPRKEHFLHLV